MLSSTRDHVSAGVRSQLAEMSIYLSLSFLLGCRAAPVRINVSMSSASSSAGASIAAGGRSDAGGKDFYLAHRRHCLVASSYVRMKEKAKIISIALYVALF